MSVLRSAEECKWRKAKRLGKVNIIGTEEFAELNLDVKVELIKSLIPLGLMHVQDLLYEEVEALAGARYARKKGGQPASPPRQQCRQRKDCGPKSADPCAPGQAAIRRRGASSFLDRAK